MAPLGLVPARRIALLIGAPGTCKTTVCQRLVAIARQKGLRVHGLISEASRLSSGRIVQTVRNVRTGERRRLAEYVGVDEGEPIGCGIAGRFSWAFVGESVRWGRHELHRCLARTTDLLVIDQLGPLELLAGSGWINAVRVLLEARYALAVVVVNPLVVAQLRDRLDGADLWEIEATQATPDEMEARLLRLALESAMGTAHRRMSDAPEPGGTWAAGTVDAFIERAKELSADIIGMSALLTTTMEEQKKVIGRIKDEGLPYKTVVGGAPCRSGGPTRSAPTPTPRTPTTASKDGRAARALRAQEGLGMDTAGQDITVQFFATMRELFGSDEVQVPADQAGVVTDLIDVLSDSPSRRQALRDESGRLRKDIAVLVNGRNIAFVGGVDTRLKAGDVISVFPPVFGG